MHDQDWYSQKDPNDPQPIPTGYPPRQARLWPYVLAGVVTALLLWAYLEPIPEHTRPEPVVYQVP